MGNKKALSNIFVVRKCLKKGGLAILLSPNKEE